MLEVPAAFGADVAHYLGVQKFVLLGWSGGGPYLLTYAALFPERFTRAVIVGSPSSPFNIATAHNDSRAMLAMKIPRIGMWALKRL